MEEPGGADEEGAIEADEEIGDAGFAGFQDAGAGDAGGEAGGFDAFDGGAEAVEVEVIESDTVGPEGDCGGELFRVADQQMELRFGVGRGSGGCAWRWRMNFALGRGGLEGLQLFHSFAPELV